jgi:hypothetical protein
VLQQLEHKNVSVSPKVLCSVWKLSSNRGRRSEQKLPAKTRCHSGVGSQNMLSSSEPMIEAESRSGQYATNGEWACRNEVPRNYAWRQTG